MRRLAQIDSRQCRRKSPAYAPPTMAEPHGPTAVLLNTGYAHAFLNGARGMSFVPEGRGVETDAQAEFRNRPRRFPPIVGEVGRRHRARKRRAVCIPLRCVRARRGT